MNEIITAIIAGLGGMATFWGLVKSGLIKIQIGKNENTGGLKEKLESLESNHLEHIETKLDKLIELAQESLFILRELKK